MSGPGGTIKVTPEQVLAVKSRFDNQKAQFEEALNRMKADVENLVGEGWWGASARAFHTAHMDWQQSAARVQVALGEIDQAMQIAVQQLEEGDTAGAGAFR